MQRHADGWQTSVAWVTLAILAVVTTVVGVSVFFVEDPFPREAQILVASFAVGMGLFSLAITMTSFRHGERWAWAVLWFYPVFFLAHVLALGTVVPDLLLAVIAALALLLPAGRFLGQREGGEPGDAGRAEPAEPSP